MKDEKQRSDLGEQAGAWWKVYYYGLAVGLYCFTTAYYFAKSPYFANNAPIYMALLTCLITCFFPYGGIAILAAALSLSSGLVEQLNSLLGTHFIRFGVPGFDITLGFILGITLGQRRFLRIGQQHLPIPLLTILHSWIIISALVASMGNIWQSASVVSVRGFLFNLSYARDLNWHFDYFPLTDLLVYSLCFLLLFPVVGLTRKHPDTARKALFWGVYSGCLINFLTSVLQKSRDIGWARDGLYMGLNGFWSDLHAFSGFMSFCLFLGLYMLRRTQDALLQRLAALSMVLMAATCILWSQSRFTILMTLIVATGYFIYFMATVSRKQKILGFFAVLGLGVASYVVLKTGVRGFTFESIQNLYQNFSFKQMNLVFSYRPEVFLAAVRMYSEFPWFGLGQGSFNHLSSIPGFSTSSFTLNSGGENAHNYLLQTFTELGPIGFLGFTALIASCIRSTEGQNRSFMWHALGGILIGNVFAHSLLIREMLMLTFLVLGLGWGFRRPNQETSPRPLQFSSRSYRIAAGIAAALVLLMAGREIKSSFHKSPFIYGRECHAAGPLSSDGWAPGLYEFDVPKDLESLSFVINPGHPDIERRPLHIEISALNPENVRLVQTLLVKEHGDIPIQIQGTQIEPAHRLRIKTSRCYVPLNLGVAFDPRMLGFQLKDVQLSSRASPSTKALN